MSFEKLKQRRAVNLETRKVRSNKLKRMLLKRGSSVFEKFGVRKVIVFGSVANGVFSEKSDLDILVIPLTNEKFWAFRHELEEAVGVPVDLYTDKDNSVFVKKIISRGETLYEV